MSARRGAEIAEEDGRQRLRRALLLRVSASPREPPSSWRASPRAEGAAAQGGGRV